MGEQSTSGEPAPRGSWLQIAKATLKASSKDRITMGAASLAFHWFLAIFPAAVALIAISGLAHLGPHQVTSLVHGVDVLLPSQAAQVIAEALRSPAKGRAVGLTEAVLGGLIALWSSIEAMASLQVGLDLAFETHGDRGFIGRRLMAVPLLGLTVALGGASFALIVLGHPIASLIRENVPAIGSIFASVWSVARWPAAILAVGALMSAYYAIGPDRPRLRWRPVTWGSALATLGWFLASFGFEFYLDHFAHETRTYGAFAGVVVLLLWLFLTATMVLAGAELDRQLETAPTPSLPRGSRVFRALEPGGEKNPETESSNVLRARIQSLRARHRVDRDETS